MAKPGSHFVSNLRPHAVAILAVAAALACSLLSLPLVERSQLFLLLAAVVLSAWYGGARPGLLATALAVLVQHTVFETQGHDWIRTAMFVLICAGICAAAAGRRRAEARLREQREELAVTLASIADAVVVTDVAGRVRFMNAAAERLTGRSAQEARGRPLPAICPLVSEETRAPVESPAARVVRDGALAPRTGLLLVRRDGQERPVDESGARLFDPEGAVDGAVLVLRDLTERRSIEREQAAVIAREQSARRDAAALSAVGQALVQSLDRASVGRHIAEGIRTLLGGSISVLWELDAMTGRLVAVAASGAGDNFAPGTAIPGDEMVAGLAVREGAPVASPDMLSDPRVVLHPETRALAERSSHRAVLAVPLTIGGRITGVLAVGDAQGRTFAPHEIQRLQDFANQAAIALENTRLFALESARRAQMEALAAVQRELSAELDLDRLLGLIIERAGQLLDGASFAYLVDEEGHPSGTRVWTRREPAPEAPFPAHGGLVASCASARQGLLANDYPRSPYALPEVVQLGVRHAMAVPLVSRDRLLGVLVLARPEEGRPFSREDLVTFEGLAVQAAVAVDNAMLFIEAGARQREAEVLAELARSINAAHDVGTVLQRVVDGAKELCGCDLTGVALRESESGSVVMRNRAGEYRSPPDRLVIEPGHGAGGFVLETGQPFRSDNLVRDPRLIPNPADRVDVEGIVTSLVVPILVEGAVEGLLYVHRRTPRPFTDRNESTLRLLAEYASIAIHNMRLLAHEHQMRAEAEGASRMKDEFLATISHELRSPLQPLLNWAYLLRSPNLDPASAERALDAIERSTKTLGQLIEDLLDVSRIVTGKLRLQARPVRLPGVVRAAMEAVESAALAKSVTLDAHIDPDVPAVLGDPDRLQQVLWNLLSNGIKFTPRGGRVTVSVSTQDGDVVLTVADSGAGIKPEFLPHVFERFRQAESSTNRAYGGLGLGLAIVRHLVELHGGSVSVASDGEGRGATFTVRLPVAAAARPPAERPPAAVSTEPPAGTSLSGLRILVVDDEADAREVMRFMLERGGARVLIADSAGAALDAIREERPDLLISDIGMPVEDGYVMVRRLRAMEDGMGSRLPAIALTAYASEEDARRARNAGFDAHLSKPVDPARLIEIALRLAGARPRV
ncbi:MAG TPA: GAF domain-containing protein [Methylomirabilota bacterium]|nr:GAF domain-containing protein [Methylomirabilota bacterium]